MKRKTILTLAAVGVVGALATVSIPAVAGGLGPEFRLGVGAAASCSRPEALQGLTVASAEEQTDNFTPVFASYGQPEGASNPVA